MVDSRADLQMGGWTDAAQKLYNQHKCEDIENNMKQTWKVIKSVINNKCTSTSVMEINSGGTILKDPKLFANKFNSYFTSIGQIQLVKKFEPTTGCPLMLIDNNNNNNNNNMFLYPTDVLEI